MIKATGQEFLDFYNDSSVWWPGYWHEHVSIKVDGTLVEDFEDVIQPTSMVHVVGGIIYNDNDDEVMSFETAFRRWKKQQKTKKLLVECDTQIADAVIAAVKAAGGRVKLG
jgi:hypothetical protein